MARKSVVVTSCDQCGTEAVTDLPRANARDQFVLPENWLHVTGSTTRTDSLFAMDLCEECVQPVLGIAGRWQQRQQRKREAATV
jgi:hypothetical protein